MAVAIIPARGGSKRIPGKNIRLFHGRPMIAWSIEAARASGCFDRIIVSTDDPLIADVARREGAELPFTRPEHLADDHSTTLDVMQHALSWLIDHNIHPQYTCCLYATAPFVTPQSLQAGLAMLREQASAYVFTATTYDYPVQRALLQKPDGGVDFAYPEHRTTRSQDLPELLHDAGQFYWGHTQAFVDGVPLLGPDAHPLVIPRARAQDIDTEDDWVLAEALFSRQRAQS